MTLWGRTAEVAHQYLVKGRPVYIEGRLQMDTWDDKETDKKRTKMKIVGESLQLLGSASGSGGNGQQQSRASQPPRQQQAPPANDYQDDDDIPF